VGNPGWTTSAVLTGARAAGVSTRQIRKAIENDTLPVVKIATTGRHGWAYVFTEDDLNAANLNPDRPGPIPKGAADAHIALAGGVYVVLGTHNRKGHPYKYKRLAVARRRAREAYDERLIFRPGEQFLVEADDGDVVAATVVEGVTNIDQTIIALVKGKRRVVRRDALITIVG
jgi:hypothetical protein